MSRKMLEAPASPTWAAGSSFVDFYNREFLRGYGLELSDYRIRCYEQSVARLVKFCSAKSPTLAELTPELIDKLIIACHLDRRSQKWRDDVRCCLTKIMRSWNRSFGRPPVPPPAAGSLFDHFERHYLPERLVGAKVKTIVEYRTALSALRKYRGTDVRIDELDDAVCADFFRHLLDSGRRPATVNKARAHLLAVARDAANRGLTAYQPQVKKLREVRNPPDAWSVDELRRLVLTAATFRAGQRYGSIDCGRWWTALLLVGYLTGLRRSSLLAIRTCEVDFVKRVLFVPGDQMKNRHGQQFGLSREAIRAIKRIIRPTRELLFECPYNADTITEHFAALIRAAGIRPGRHARLNMFHKLRRTCCTEVMARSSLAVASHLMGHSGEYVTRFYLDPSRAKAHDVTKILPAIAS